VGSGRPHDWRATLHAAGPGKGPASQCPRQQEYRKYIDAE